MMSPFLFRIAVWDDEERNDYGVIWNTSYAAAAADLEQYYNVDMIDMELFMCEEGPLYINKDLFDKFKNSPEVFYENS